MDSHRTSPTTSPSTLPPHRRPALKRGTQYLTFLRLKALARRVRTPRMLGEARLPAISNASRSERTDRRFPRILMRTPRNGPGAAISRRRGISFEISEKKCAEQPGNAQKAQKAAEGSSERHKDRARVEGKKHVDRPFILLTRVRLKNSRPSFLGDHTDRDGSLTRSATCHSPPAPRHPASAVWPASESAVARLLVAGD
ncbi:uncharacterized protein LAESUDRAFT_541327 [Laetiporus sulphureus 93-53]|uniref:Uncharacterized protein n=1 Tax=Laetiporus sulphureus 93-53 TaxID=1314785 RepID=A0A165FLT7_9APHY|nr:uncharacterized protein LAESUDRAFT_541327 [Laetiporus sulphureus 93-53]KZT09164.1 hypothetical protein LAESUDRAFT_541327 [Laetiporus sulphureus 93-53]